jgi:hypothetical protein
MRWGRTAILTPVKPTDREARAALRKTWPGGKYRLGEEPGANLRRRTTAEERLAMMWPLALDAWGLSGRPIPRYARHETPLKRLPSPSRRTTD